MTLFEQAPPALGNQYDDDRVLRSYLSRVLPPDVLSTGHERASSRRIDQPARAGLLTRQRDLPALIGYGRRFNPA